VKRTAALESRQLRCWLAVAIIAIPVLAVSPSHLRAELRAANGNMARFPPPNGVSPRDYNQKLARGVVARVPAHASVAAVGAVLSESWTRWVAYAIAPRQLTTGSAQWTMVFGETPQQAGLHPRRAWRYGADWLVER